MNRLIRHFLLASACLLVPFAAAKAAESKKKVTYEKLFKDGDVVAKGMFKVHMNDSKVYFEIPDSLFDKPLLLGSTISAINDNGDGLVGQKVENPLHVTFIRRDSTIFLCEYPDRHSVVDPRYENISKALEINKIPRILFKYNVKAYAPDSAVVIDVTNIFLDDVKQLRPFDKSGGSSMGGLGTRSVKFQKDLAYLKGIKAFDDNVSVKSVLSYTSDIKVLGQFSLASDKPTTAEMTRTFLRIPDEPMHPRIADSRIGTFYRGVEHFAADDDQVKALYYANRWKIEPKDEAAYRRGELVEPVKPIVFYVDDAFPEDWKPAIKQGIEDWNLAFEEIGFKNVMRAVDFPSKEEDPDFDPDNLKYSCVRYAPTWVANAMGPSWKDPRSGEILCASVYIHHNIIKLINSWRFALTAQVDPRVRTKVMSRDVLQESLRYVAAHEVGHCLGLMHNMAASSAYPVDSLRSVSFTKVHGTTPSIMDYARFNYVAQPEDNGVRLTPPVLGLYDYYIIKWMYTPIYGTPEEEAKTLDRWISEKAGDPIYRYGRQQLYARMDPSSIEEDLGDDPIKASTYGIKNLKYLMKHLNEWFEDEDPDYSHRSMLYSQIISQYKRYLNNVLMNIGGLYLYDVREGDPHKSYEPVPKEVQRKSLEFLLDQIYDMDWLYNEELTSHLSPSLSPIETIQFGSSAFVISLVSAAKRNAVFLASTFEKGEKYTLEEYMDDLYNRIFDKTIRGKSLDEIDRAYETFFIVNLLSGVDASYKAGTVLFADPEHVVNGTVNDFDRAYAPSLDDIILYGLDPTGTAEKYEGLIRGGLGNIKDGYEDTNAFAWQRAIKIDSNHNLKYVNFAYLQKVRTLLSKRKNSGDETTKAYYAHLIYKIDRLVGDKK